MASNEYENPYRDAYAASQRYDSPGNERQAHDPFDDSNHAYPHHDGLYPPRQPYSQPYEQFSRDSFDDYGIPKEANVGATSTGAAAGAGYRDAHANPYSAQYQANKGGKKKWWIIGAVVLVVM